MNEQVVGLEDQDDPNNGHTFRITAVSRGSYAVVGDANFTDAPDFEYEFPFTIDMRAWSLPDAIRKVAQLPLASWRHPDPEEDAERFELRVQAVAKTLRQPRYLDTLAAVDQDHLEALARNLLNAADAAARPLIAPRRVTTEQEWLDYVWDRHGVALIDGSEAYCATCKQWMGNDAFRDHFVRIVMNNNNKEDEQ